MNELDENLARLFADDEASDAELEAFAAAVRRRVARQRILAKTLAICGIAGAAAAAIALAAFVPGVVAYPGDVVGRLLGSPLGAAACLLGSLAAAWWSRYGDA